MIIKGNIEVIARELNTAIQEYLTTEGKTETNSEEVMDYLVDKGLFEKEKKKKFKTAKLEKLMEELVRIGREKLVTGMRSEKVKKKTIWYFTKA